MGRERWPWLLAAFPQAPPYPTALTLLSPGIISHCSLLLPTTVCQNISTGTPAQLKPKLLRWLFFDLKVLCTQYTNIDVVITYPNCAGTHKPVLALCGATPSTYWLVMVGRLKIGRPLCCHFRAKFACVKFNLLRSHSCKSGFVVPI